jgi:hypothetical protein
VFGKLVSCNVTPLSGRSLRDELRVGGRKGGDVGD